MRPSHISSLAILLLGSAGLAGQTLPVHTQRSRHPTYAEYGFSLLGSLLSQDSTSNVVVSPVSAGFAFGLVARASSGGARIQLLAALQVPDDATRGPILAPTPQELASLQASGDPIVSIATSFWVDRNYPLRPEFAARARMDVDATADTVDFADPKTRERINLWVANHTAQRIPNLIARPIWRDPKVMVINALYFKGSWQTAFDSAATYPEAFFEPDGSERRMPFMHRTGDLQYYSQSTFEAVELPYVGGRLTATILLPAKGISPASLLASLAHRWPTLRDSMARERIALALPRFRTEGRIDLKRPMTELGAGSVFEELSSPIDQMTVGPDHLYVGHAEQVTFLEVTEQGTEAAAATGLSLLVPRDAVTARVRPFRVDRPFLFILHDTATGLILFVGQIARPQSPA